MNLPSTRGRRLQTGLFEIDLESSEVHKNGRRLRLQEQPFRVLAMLLEQPGAVVTREDLQARVWPADTYVGFDEGLNTAIRKLRIAFDDSADNPRFIETIPRRGYRFIAPVVETSEPPPTYQDSAKAEPGQGLPSPTAATTTNRRRRLRLAVSFSVGLVLILASLVYVARSRPAAHPAAVKRAMLAILPFENLSNDPTQEYFSDGVTEETITDLGQLNPEKLGVIARTSAMTYKHTDKTVSQIGQELHVDYILEGSVRREGKRIRISAQLIRVSDQTHLWAENYDRELKDVIQVQNEIGLAIAEQVQANLSPQRQMQLAEMRTVDPEAHDLYLKGRFYWNQRTPVAIKKSIELFREATVKDPNFALAYSGLADAYNISNILGAYTPKESFPEARAAAMKAISLDPTLAEAHAALGMEKSHYEFDFPGAEKEFLTALRLNPNSAYAHLFYSNCYLMPMGRTAEAIAENQKAVALDPLSLPINNFLGVSYYFAGDYDRSYRQFQHTIAMDPSFPLAHEYFSALLMMMGRFDEAIREHEKSEMLTGSSPEAATAEAATMERAYKAGGERGFWQKHLELDLKVAGPGAYGVVAGDYALVGEKDKAFEFLEKARAQKEGGDISLLKCDPTFKDLRGDPRFSDMLRRLGLPE